MIPFKKVKSGMQLLAKGKLTQFCQHAAPFAESLRAAPKFYFRVLTRRAAPASVAVRTDHPIAADSLDTIIPFGTAQDNSTNRAFINKLHDLTCARTGKRRGAMLDLGCSGGQLVADFRAIGWDAVGLEGSDYSLRRGRANWRTLGNIALFTCDITKPFEVSIDGERARFDLVTAWEVLEHIPEGSLKVLFASILRHMTPESLFIASTAQHSDIHQGRDLHVTRMSNADWHRWIAAHVPELVPVDLGLKKTEYVRCVGDSFLTLCRKG